MNTATIRTNVLLGRYFVVIEHHVDLEDLARQVGAIQPWETLK